MDYTTLFNTIKTYTENDFPSTSFSATNGTSTVTTASKTQIDTFIQLAEERIYNSVQLPALRKNVEGNMTAGNKYVTLPSDWLATYSIARIESDGSQYFLLNKDVSYMREAFPAPNSLGAPSQYAVFDANTLILGPTPDSSYGLEMHYFYYPESIVTAGTTWLGDHFETVLLYGSLREAYVFMKGEADIIAQVEQKYAESLALLKRLGDGLDRRDAYRSGQVRTQVT